MDRSDIPPRHKNDWAYALTVIICTTSLVLGCLGLFDHGPWK